MDPISQETFDIILSKDASQLSADERAFLIARRDYLNKDDAKRFESVLNEKPAKKSAKKEDK